MASFKTSFRLEDRPPPHYRTPSPPPRSPTSPAVGLIQWAHPSEASHNGTPPDEIFGQKPISGLYGRGIGEDTREVWITTNGRVDQSESRPAASTMDAFAEIALATSPVFSPPQSFGFDHSASQYGHSGSASMIGSAPIHAAPGYHGGDDRPSKRARSEAPFSGGALQSQSRPATSYVPSNEWLPTGTTQTLRDSRTDDAELLLSVSRAVFTSHEAARRPVFTFPATTKTDFGDAGESWPKAERNQSHAGSQTQSQGEGGASSYTEAHTRDLAYASHGGKDFHSDAPDLSALVKSITTSSNRDAGLPHGISSSHDLSARSFVAKEANHRPTEALSAEENYGKNGLAWTHDDLLSQGDGLGIMTSPLGESGSDNDALFRRRQSAHGITDDDRQATSGTQTLAKATRGRSVPADFFVAERPATPAEPPFDPAHTVETVEAQGVAKTAMCAGCEMIPNSLRENQVEETSWISCDGCNAWYHYACAGLTEREVRSVDKFSCPKCWSTHGPTTYLRKSARAHTSIDYAGLNEGIVKTSDESPCHPYIKPIKERTIKFLPESFPRMRPELITLDIFEQGNGWKEPILVPAWMNPSREPIPNELVEGPPDFSRLAVEAWLQEEYDTSYVPDEGQDALGMVIPQHLTVRRVAELYGPLEKVPVIDVKSQGEAGSWNMQKWADYYESKEKKYIRNVISLEISYSKLGRLVKRPKVVQQLDLVDSVWPAELKAKGEFPRVQLYCLMSIADSYTDFHIDFGGSSVFYHIIKGKKTFLFIPPKSKHLKKYEQWCLSPAQNETFLPDQTKECYRVDLSAGDTMLIPSGWIHAVWTPEDSLVIGGNFLTRLHFGMQIQIAEIEKTTKVPRRFRQPHFQRILWFTAIRHLADDPIPSAVEDALQAGGEFTRDIPGYNEFEAWGANSKPGADNYQARYYSQYELEGLPHLARYLLRNALITMDLITDGITADTRAAVTRAIPKGHGQPLEIVKKFAVWSAWKRGNEQIPEWAYPDAVPGVGVPGAGEKKLTAAAMRKLDRQAAVKTRVVPARQSVRKEVSSTASVQAVETDAGKEPNGVIIADAEVNPGPAKSTQVKLEKASRKRSLGSDVETPSSIPGTGLKRIACDTCRKRRTRCDHKESGSPVVVQNSAKQPDAARVRPAGTEATQPEAEGARPAHTEAATSWPVMVSVVVDSSEPRNEGVANETPAGPVHETPPPDLQQERRDSSSAKKSTACSGCRKSKRRCLHVEDDLANSDVTPSAKRGPGCDVEVRAMKKLKVEEDLVPFAAQVAPSQSPGSAEPVPAESVPTGTLLQAEEVVGRYVEDTHVSDAVQEASESVANDTLRSPSQPSEVVEDEVQLVATSPKLIPVVEICTGKSSASEETATPDAAKSEPPGAPSPEAQNEDFTTRPLSPPSSPLSDVDSPSPSSKPATTQVSPRDHSRRSNRASKPVMPFLIESPTPVKEKKSAPASTSKKRTLIQTPPVSLVNGKSTSPEADKPRPRRRSGAAVRLTSPAKASVSQSKSKSKSPTKAATLSTTGVGSKAGEADDAEEESLRLAKQLAFGLRRSSARPSL